MFPPNFIVTDRIESNDDIQSKKRALQRLSELLASSAPGLDPQRVFDHLLERERLGSTGLGHGIALPHARMPELDRAVGAFLRLPQGIGFDAIDDRPVDLAFALLVPQEATEEHLQLLAKLASMFGNPRLTESLRRAEDTEAILRLIEEGEALPAGAV